jgi:hypothetical protein
MPFPLNLDPANLYGLRLRAFPCSLWFYYIPEENIFRPSVNYDCYIFYTSSCWCKMQINKKHASSSSLSFLATADRDNQLTLREVRFLPSIDPTLFIPYILNLTTVKIWINLGGERTNITEDPELKFVVRLRSVNWKFPWRKDS